jgi:hypothetical protein
MALPGFTATDALYRSTRTYRRQNTATTPGLALAGTLLPGYSCAGKPDGKYRHPTDCTKYVTCTGQKTAVATDCANCDFNPNTCPRGKLQFDQDLGRCLFANDAGCVTG